MKYLRIIILILLTYSFAIHAKVLIGTPVFYPPFVIINDGHYLTSGFDIELMKEVCARLHWDCAWKEMDEAKLLSALLHREVDLLIGGIPIPSVPANGCLFSIPYMITTGSFLVSNQNGGLGTFDALKDKRVGVVEGQLYATYLKNHAPTTLTIIPYKNFVDLVAAIIGHQVDAVFMNHYTALFLAYKYPDKVYALGGEVALGSGVGIATRVDNKDLIEKINKVIMQMQADGTFLKLYNYNFQFFTKQ